MSSLLNGAGDRSFPLATLESSLQSSWSPSMSALGLGTGAFGSHTGKGIVGIDGNSDLERAARMHRNAASLCDPICTWSGDLPPRNYKNATYSRKVFLGGVPLDMTEFSFTHAFKQFGSIKVEWPGKENVSSRNKGFVYIIFDAERHVKSLLQACTHDNRNGNSWYFKIPSSRSKI